MQKFLLMIAMVALVGCGESKDSPESQATPKAEPTSVVMTAGIAAAKKAYDEGRYADSVRLYDVELAAEEAKAAPSWMKLSLLNNQLGIALDAAGQYDKALEYHQKSLAIKVKQLGLGHHDVATAYNNIGMVYVQKVSTTRPWSFIRKPCPSSSSN